ncbi:MAG: hypothetical protein WCL27_09015 [Betaproteobacteria bacterium]
MGKKQKSKAESFEVTVEISDGTTYFGQMKMSELAVKSFVLQGINGGLRLGDGTTAVALGNGLTLIEARDLMYIHFGCEVTEASRGYQRWRASRCVIASVEEQYEMITGMNRKNALHMAAFMALPELVSRLLSEGYEVNGGFFVGKKKCRGLTPLVGMLWKNADFDCAESPVTVDVVRILVAAGAKITEDMINDARQSGHTQSAALLEQVLLKRKPMGANTTRYAKTI